VQVQHAHKRDEVPAPARAKGGAGPGDEAPPSAAEAQAVGEAALLERRLALFSRAFLDAFDPIDRRSAHKADDKSEKVARLRPPRIAGAAA
jgi:hypothetical protein